ncbi:hypothetical protein BSL78_14582 [Apostichopus japonicus]|uniref:Reverse transcriptase RNase H-like domain-containing protein n=1 Tax=Stichopus japonicus TaxID=307972 RepID=A0A2G8KKQ6_STIJA|nr:hypothetical protein BSL78_14582 [Apostichopus japonicus]
MVNYCARFIPNLATISLPLRNLIKKDEQWNWTSRHQQALDTIKETLSKNTVNAFSHASKETEVAVDASTVGLGAILAQRSNPQAPAKVVAYASRSLMPTEQKYSQTEREALAIVWACEHFHLFLYGKEFVLVTDDHKPLEYIFNNPASKPPARIERWSLRLQPYVFKVVHKEGRSNPADYMLRHPLNEVLCNDDCTKTEQYINFVAFHATPKAMNIDEIKEATQADTLLQNVSDAMHHDNWHDAKKRYPELLPYFHIRDEMTIHADQILY